LFPTLIEYVKCMYF